MTQLKFILFDLVIINRKYLIGGKWFRFETKTKMFKIAIGKYEFRFHKK